MLDGICLLGLAGLEDILEVPRRDEDAEVRDLRGRDEVVLVVGGTGVERMAKACGRRMSRW